VAADEDGVGGDDAADCLRYLVATRDGEPFRTPRSATTIHEVNVTIWGSEFVADLGSLTALLISGIHPLSAKKILEC